MRFPGLSALGLAAFIAILPCGFVSLEPDPIPAVPAFLTEAQRYRVTIATSYTNRTGRAQSLEFRVPLIISRGSQQVVSDLVVRPRPASLERDAFGNTIACYRYDNLRPGQFIQLSQQATVTRQGESFELDSRLCSSSSLPLMRSQHVSPTQMLARAVTAGENNALYRAVRLYDYVRSFRYELQENARSTDDALRSRVVQCEDAARVLQALLAEVAIPSRLASGIVVMNETPRKTATHTWVLANLGDYERVPLDPTMGRFPGTRDSRLGQLDPQYITLWEGPAHCGFSVSGAQEAELDKSIVAQQLSVRCPRSTRLNSRLAVPPLGRNWTCHGDVESAVPPVLRQALARAASISAPAQRMAYVWRLRQGVLPLPHVASALTIPLVNAAAEANQLPLLARQLRQEAPSEARNLAMGLAAVYANKWSAAERCIAQAGPSVSANLVRALLFSRTKQLLRATHALDAAASQELTTSGLDLLLQMSADMGDWQLQALVARHACRLFPNVDYHIALAQACFRSNDLPQCLAAIRAAELAVPGDGYPQAVLGTLYAERAQYEPAIKCLDKALKQELPPDEREEYAALRAQLRVARNLLPGK